MEPLPPDSQETPEHLDLIEQEMREIRARMAPDIQDLRRHAEPQALGEQATRNLRSRLVSLLGRARRQRRKDP